MDIIGLVLKPFVWMLMFFYNITGSYGVALILFAFVIKLILFPVTLKGKKSMIQTNMLSGKMEQLKKQYGKDKNRYNQEVQNLYAREQVNPMGGCVWSIIPLVLLLALYAIIREPLFQLMNVPKEAIEQVAAITGVANTGAYPQIAMAQALNDSAMLAQVKAALGEAGSGLFALDFSFLGLNLAATPNAKFWTLAPSWGAIGLFILPVVSVVVSFLSMKVSMATNKLNNQSSSQMDKTNKMMLYTMPLMSLWIGYTVPAGLSIYWIAQYLVTMAQEIICGKMLAKDYEKARVAAAERERQEKEDEKRRKEEARLEKQRRIEEEKRNRGKKKAAAEGDEPTGADVNKADSREGIRAYARGRAYIPGRYAVTDYIDPNDALHAWLEAKAAAEAAKPAKRSALPSFKRKTDEPSAPVTAEQAVEAPAREVTEAAPETEAAPVTEAAPETEAAPVVTEEVEIEVEQVEVEVDDENKEGV